MRPWEAWPCAPPHGFRHLRWHWLRDADGAPVVLDWAGTNGHGWHGGWSGTPHREDMHEWTYLCPVYPPDPGFAVSDRV